MVMPQSQERKICFLVECKKDLYTYRLLRVEYQLMVIKLTLPQSTAIKAITCNTLLLIFFISIYMIENNL